MTQQTQRTFARCVCCVMSFRLVATSWRLPRLWGSYGENVYNGFWA